MTRGLEKKAAGELTARLARWMSTPIKGTPKLVQKVRTGPELDALEQGIRNSASKYVESPIRKGLLAARVDRGVENLAYRAAPLIKPKLGPVSRRQWADQVGRNTVDLASSRPHSALGHTVSPIPGSGMAIDALESLKTRLLNATPGLRVPTYKTITPPRGGGIVSGEMGAVKLANGDMLQYYADHPEKLREKQKRDRKKKDGHTKIAQVVPYQQKTQWTCSAACLKAVIEHHGVRIPELVAIELVGARPGRGAECNQIAEAARKIGFLAFEYSFDSIDQARFLLDQELPIICDIQSFNNPGKGHYVVMVAADDHQVEIMDPNTPGNWRTISRTEMDARWWDRAMAPPHEMMPKWGIVIVPPED